MEGANGGYIYSATDRIDWYYMNNLKHRDHWLCLSHVGGWSEIPGENKYDSEVMASYLECKDP